MLTRRSFASLAVLVVALVAVPAAAQEKIKTVATFSILADLVKNVGGDRIEIATLVGPNGDAHVYSPTPADAKTVGEAKVVFLNGLGLEGWMTRLVKAAGGNGVTVVATTGIKPLKMEDEHKPGHMVTDPHAWQSVANVKTYVANIRDGLVKADPAGKATYEGNARIYLDKLNALEQDVKAAIAKFPPITVASSPPMTPSAISAPLTGWSSSRPKGSRPSRKPLPRTLPRSSGRSGSRKSRRFSWRIFPTRA